MRTTVRIDDDLMRALKDRAHREQASIARILNTVIRQGLSAQPAKRQKPFKQQTYDMGPPLIDLTKASAFAAELEDEEILRKMAQGK